MPLFLIAKSRRTNGHFEVHRVDCPAAPQSPQSHMLGTFLNPARALSEARGLYPRCDTCDRCCSTATADDADEPRTWVQSRA